jgi:hypothetical protein
MVSILKINHFSMAANQAYAAPTAQYLSMNSNGLSVQIKDCPSSFSKEQLQQNTTTWKVFRESLTEIIGSKKFDWICHRYRNRMNFSRLEASGAALLPQHVELFSVGSAQVLEGDIEDRFNKRELKTFSREELTDKMRRLQPFSILGSPQDPSKLRSWWVSLLSFFVHDKLFMDKKKQWMFSGIKNLNFYSWLERLCKRLVSLELIPGQIIPTPGPDGCSDYYKVYRKVTTGDGLIAYALKPAVADSTLKPLIVFRPTQTSFANEDAFESYYNDVQPNVGEAGFKGSEEELAKLMADSCFRQEKEKISIAGYSLGGAHAQYFLAAHADHIAHAVFYADPSLDNAVAERFAEEMNKKPRRKEPLNIPIYRTKGDPCHHVGGKHVGWGVTHPDVNIQLVEIDHHKKTASALELHAHRVFDTHHISYRMQSCKNQAQLFQQLDNSKRGMDVYWYEKMRLLWGRAAYYLFYSTSCALHVVTTVTGLKILRRSTDLDC